MPSEEFNSLLKLLLSRPQPENPTIDEMRALMEKAAKFFDLPAGVTCESIDAGGVRAEWIIPEVVEGNRTIFYLHGGGYAIGSLSTHRHLVALLAQAAKARALSVDYRLAPEHPFPAAVEDATAAYRWLLAQGTDAGDIVIAGDSAGGGLAIATQLTLRDAGDALPAAAVCFSPWVDMECNSESMTSSTNDPLIQQSRIRQFVTWYLNGADPKSPLAAPIHADLSGLPPMLIHVSTAEALLDDSVQLADRARTHGVDTTLDTWDDMIHVWHYYAPIIPEGRDAVERAAAFIRERVAPV